MATMSNPNPSEGKDFDTPLNQLRYFQFVQLFATKWFEGACATKGSIGTAATIFDNREFLLNFDS
jgi:hypothetical protein